MMLPTKPTPAFKKGTRKPSKANHKMPPVLQRSTALLPTKIVVPRWGKKKNRQAGHWLTQLDNIIPQQERQRRARRFGRKRERYIKLLQMEQESRQKESL